MCESPRWRKILYVKQPWPDNYSGGDEQFLNEMKKNVSVVKYSYSSALAGAAHLMTHLAAVALHAILFFAVRHEQISPVVVASIFCLASVLLYLIHSWLWQEKTHVKERLADHAHTLATFLLFGLALTPIIRTLTDTISTDTIYALSSLATLASCVFHDYGIDAPIVCRPVSVSCGLAACVFLISRLESNHAAFLLLSISFALHEYWPRIRNRLVSFAPACVSLSLLSNVCCVLLLPRQLRALWAGGYVVVVFVFPAVLIRLQAGKRNIHGPWDEAVPKRG